MEEKIKTFPLQFLTSQLKAINERAKQEGVTTKEFIMAAIAKAMQK